MYNGITDVFFDLDHTLWDFEKNSALTFEKIFKENGMQIALPDFLKVYVPLNLKFWRLYREEKLTKSELRYQRLKTAFDEIELPVSDIQINQLASDYITHLSSFNNLFPGTIGLLDYLKTKYRLHIITNGFEEIQEKKMKNANILSYFDVVVNSEMAGVKKPNPKIFEMALDKACIPAERALMIGDSFEADILGAKNVGFQVLHFNPDIGEPHEICPIVTDLNEIKDFL